MESDSSTQFLRAVGGEISTHVKKRLKGEAFGSSEAVEFESEKSLTEFHIVAHSVWAA